MKKLQYRYRYLNYGNTYRSETTVKVGIVTAGKPRELQYLTSKNSLVGGQTTNTEEAPEETKKKMNSPFEQGPDI